MEKYSVESLIFFYMYVDKLTAQFINYALNNLIFVELLSSAFFQEATVYSLRVCNPMHTIVASLFLWGVNWLSENIEHSIDAYVEAPSAMTTLIKNQNI